MLLLVAADRQLQMPVAGGGTDAEKAMGVGQREAKPEYGEHNHYGRQFQVHGMVEETCREEERGFLFSLSYQNALWTSAAGRRMQHRQRYVEQVDAQG